MAARLTLAYRPPRGQNALKRVFHALARVYGETGSRRSLIYNVTFAGYIQASFLSGLWRDTAVSDMARQTPGWILTIIQLCLAIIFYWFSLTLFLRLTRWEVRWAGIGLCGLLAVAPISVSAVKVLEVWGPAREISWSAITISLFMDTSVALFLWNFGRIGAVEETEPVSYTRRYLVTVSLDFLAFVGLLFVPGLLLHLRPVPLALVHSGGSAAIVISAAALLRMGNPRFVRPLTTFLSCVATLPLGAGIAYVLLKDPWGGAASVAIGLIAWRPLQRLGTAAAARAEAFGVTSSPPA